MERKRYLIEIGTGVDMHGGDMTGAALKAVNAQYCSNVNR